MCLRAVAGRTCDVPQRVCQDMKCKMHHVYKPEFLRAVLARLHVHAFGRSSSHDCMHVKIAYVKQ